MLTQSPGAEWVKHGITVNAVAPGPVETKIAGAVIFGASDHANFMTGETVYVSGGPRVANCEESAR